MTTQETRTRHLSVIGALALALALALSLAACGGGTGGSGTVARQVPRVERFIVAADSAAEYKGIWQVAPSQSQLRESLSVLAQADGSLVRVQPQATANAAQYWLEAYKSSAAGVVTLIGHNEQGVFRFADGSYVNLSDLSGLDGPPLIVFSCDAARNTQGQVVGTVPEAVTLQVAAEIEQRVVAAVREQDVTEPRALEILVDSVTADVLVENSAYGMAGGVGVASVGVIGVSIYTVRG